ncbi:23S rRNA (uracil(1939)-C(5))-methyltransferase RlmD [Planomicrobium sp. CPCC 101110]|uniref:23S rRNA (uracil(1939)-C(5))-methyltransferase RlmD n=1 Tax=Planomicrobium sp. CPCC 101110 TaxID=2599619 RepID=UPI0011B47D9C|nr:23S rRNA (uracil(1939)-C(5))-methyltransferase RlmD [Planomicrobium sp. CPCC 101110]TWT24109.1 23S rRNA (uracil(1939)-C(5))-methyltransferase RlmD [Planomicrobium sp. CPCC 101110]
MNEKPIFEEGQKFPLTIKRLGINGEGIGYFKRNVVFVQGALPGEEITAQVTNIKRNFAEARVLKLRKPSAHRQTPPCPIYETCGGCQLQHMTYEQQLVEKRDLVAQALERYLKGASVQIKNTIGMEDPWYYRNKSQFQTRLKGTKVIAGLFAEGSHQLLDIEQCIVQHPDTTVITNAVKRILEELKIPIYDGKTMKGIVRTIVVRTGVQTGEIQLVLITTRSKIPQKELLLEKLKQIDINLVSIVQNINKEKTSLIFGDETITLYGKDTIHEELGELAFDLSARAFFQLNPVQTVKLYDEIKRAAELTGKESVVDAYCGVGTIGLWLADSAAELRGMDVIHESVVDAKANAKKMGVTAKYVTGTAEKWLETWSNEGFVPDVLTVDPPRTGLGESLLKTILKVKPKRFVYTSCNPSTLAKDLQQLTKIYRIEYIQPVDMFPQTAQVEAVTKLVLK